MKRLKQNCTAMGSKLADMLLDPAAVPAKVRAHVAECESCQADLAELQATMALLDTWEAPEASPYFLSRLDARMRDERHAAPASWFARLRARFDYGPAMPVRPLAALIWASPTGIRPHSPPPALPSFTISRSSTTTPSC